MIEQVNALVTGLMPGRRPRMDLDGKVVFITGAARGLGAEIARQVHREGASVALVGRTLAPLEAFAAELGDRAAAFHADISDMAALQAAADGTAERFGGIDVVIANAGIAPASHSIRTIDPAEFERTIDVDLLGQWRTMRATLPYVVPRQGHILVVASIYSYLNGVLNAPYAASKAAIEQLARALHVEIAPLGCSAGTAYLGFIDTDLAREVFEQSHVDEARATLPAFVTKPMPVEDAARAVVDGVKRRSTTVGAPAWVVPAMRARGLLALGDAWLARNKGLAAAVAKADQAG